MKAKNISVVIGLPKPGATVKTDWMCNSAIQDPLGEWHGDANDEFTMPEWKAGDSFALSIPSGTLTTKVVSVNSYGSSESAEARTRAAIFGGQQPAEEGVQLHLLGEWDGKDGGLQGGLCAFGRFQAYMAEAIVYESTLLPAGKEIGYASYAWAKDARRFLGIDNDEVVKIIEHMAGRFENSPPAQIFLCKKEAPMPNAFAEALK